MKEEVTKVKQDTIGTQQANKKLKDENENFAKVQRDLNRTQQKLTIAEQQLSVAKVQLDEAQESVRSIKAMEKSLQRELQANKLELEEVKSQKEVLNYALEQAKTERRQSIICLERAQERLKQIENKFEITNHENIENSRRLSYLEEEIKMNVALAVAEIPIEKQFQNLSDTHEKLETAHKIVLASLEQKKLEIQNMHLKVNRLVSITRNQEMELKENEEDLETLETEIATMQQFIRQKCKYFITLSSSI